MVTMKTQTAALWLIAIGSASVCGAVKLEDANPFEESQDVEGVAGEGGPEEAQLRIPPQATMKRKRWGLGVFSRDSRVRSTLALVRGFFNQAALRRRAELDQELNLLALTPHAQRLVRCIELAPQGQVQQRAQGFCSKSGPPDAQMTAMCLSTAIDAQAIMQAAADSCRERKTGDCFLRRLRIPLTHPMINRRVEGQLENEVVPLPLPLVNENDLQFNYRWQYLQEIGKIFITDFPASSAIVKEVQNEVKQLASDATKASAARKNDRLFWKAWLLIIKTMQVRPHVDPMLIRLLLQTLSFDKCANRRVEVFGSNDRFSEEHLRTHTIGTFFAEALAFRECVGWRLSNNCKTARHYARISKTLMKYYLPLNETARPISRHTKFYPGGKLEYPFEEETEAVYKFIEEETHENVTFILEGAEKVSTKIVNFISKSPVGRALIASVVTGILRHADHLRHEQREEGEGPDLRRYKLLKSKLLLKATAKVESIVRETYTYVMSGKKPLALVHRSVIYTVLLRELQRDTKRREPRRSLGQRLRSFFRFGRGQSSLQVENTSALMPGQAHGAMVKNASRWTPRRMEASFVQSDEDKGFKKRNVYLLAGATFIFLGLAVLSSVATGALSIGLIIAGIVAMLIPLPPQGIREPEEDQAPEEAEGLSEAGPEEESNQLRGLQIEEVD
ncbi:hypothetical protein Esti_000267 [Eimeria stiedai]